jgi:class 3 adenylate cyclase/tetratricopeptide (TPR) repeat protein
MICPVCGEQNPDIARFCLACGAQLGVEVAAGSRKTVTIVFSDLVGSTSLGEQTDPEALREVLDRYFSEMQRVLERHGGVVEKYIGDAVMAVFGLPRVREDDALRAVRAAAEMASTLSILNDELEQRWNVRLMHRTGVNTGEVVSGDVTPGQRLVTGDAVNVAARLEQAAPHGEVLLGESTYGLVSGWVEVEAVAPLSLKGKAELVPAFRLIEVQPELRTVRRIASPLVGRISEERALDDAFEQVSRERVCRAVLVSGEPGVGKSRLIDEFVVRARGGGAGSLRGRCLSYGEGITFWPIAQAIKEAAEITDEDPIEEARAKLAKLMVAATDADVVVGKVLGLVRATEEAGTLEETNWAIRKLFETLGSERPFVVVVEDLHWAEAALLDLLRQIVDSAKQSTILLLCSARPELLDDHATWWGAAAWMHIQLEGLSDADSGALIDGVLGEVDLPPDLRERIVRAAAGNPLFVEELLGSLVDQGLLRQDEGRWVFEGDPAALDIPPSIHALLTARLDALADADRAVLQRGSVIGDVFYSGAVTELAPEDTRHLVPPSLNVLSHKEFIAAEESTLAGNDAYAFHHVLVRDAAYGSVLKRARAELHERFAAWLQGVVGDSTEYEEIIGYHFEQAYRYLEGLGPVDEQGRSVGAQAGHLLCRAGRRALVRGDAAAAVNLLTRGLSLLPSTDPERLALAIELGEALGENDQFRRAEEVLREAADEAASTGDRAAEARALVARLYISYYTDPEIDNDVRRPQLEEAVRTLEEFGDEAGLAEALGQLATTLYTEGNFEAGDRELNRSIELGYRAGDVRREGDNRAFLTTMGTYGPTPVAETLRRCEETMSWAADKPVVQGKVLRAMARLKAMEGSFQEARDLADRSVAIFKDLVLPGSLAASQLTFGFVELMAGDPVAAEHRLRVPLESVERSGEDRLGLQILATMMADALCIQGRYPEAHRLSELGREQAHAFDVSDRVDWRFTRARVLAGMDRLQEAEALASEAVALAEPTQALNTRGDASMALAEILLAAGRPTEAVSHAEQALLLYRKKGNLVSANRAEAMLRSCRQVP